jgi:hypothetical protein
MRADRYTKIVLTVIAVALVALALNPWLSTLALPPAEAQSAVAKYEVAIPKAWGKVLGYSGGGDVLLEDKDGVLRQVEMHGKAPEYPKIKVYATRN